MTESPDKGPDIKPMWRLYSAYLRLLLPAEEESTHFLLSRNLQAQEDGDGQDQ